MILVDTSVWTDYLNGVQSQHANALDAGIVAGTVAMGDLIFLEILQGIRNDSEYRLPKVTTKSILRAKITFRGACLGDHKEISSMSFSRYFRPKTVTAF